MSRPLPTRERTLERASPPDSNPVPTSPLPPSSRSRLLLFLITLSVLSAVAAITWVTSTPDAPELVVGSVVAAENQTISAAGVLDDAGAHRPTEALLPTLAALIPTPAITPRTGVGGQAGASLVTLLPTPTLLPELAALVPPAQAAATEMNIIPTEAAVPPTSVPPTEPPLTETPLPSPTPGIEPPQRLAINGIPYEAIVVMPGTAVQHAREIYASGLAIGRNPHAYSKVGDSTVEDPHFLTRYDGGPYELGAYASLQPAIDYFRGSHSRDSVAVRVGLHSWTANDPTWADKSICLPNESPVVCEIRLHNPSVLLIHLGTNDVGVPSMFDVNMRQIVDAAIAGGVIPIIGTKADRHEGSNENNDILRQIAADYQIPLWDFDAVANTLPGRGLDQDGSHMLTFYSHDFNDPAAFTRGHPMHNLSALMMLDAIWRQVMQGGP